MAVTKEEIERIKPGCFEPFLCEDANGMHSIVSQLSNMKRYGMPEGVTDYESRKYFDKNIIIVHAMGVDERKVLNT